MQDVKLKKQHNYVCTQTHKKYEAKAAIVKWKSRNESDPQFHKPGVATIVSASLDRFSSQGRVPDCDAMLARSSIFRTDSDTR